VAHKTRDSYKDLLKSKYYTWWTLCIYSYSYSCSSRLQPHRHISVQCQWRTLSGTKDGNARAVSFSLQCVNPVSKLPNIFLINFIDRLNLASALESRRLVHSVYCVAGLVGRNGEQVRVSCDDDNNHLHHPHIHCSRHSPPSAPWCMPLYQSCHQRLSHQ